MIIDSKLNGVRKQAIPANQSGTARWTREVGADFSNGGQDLVLYQIPPTMIGKAASKAVHQLHRTISGTRQLLAAMACHPAAVKCRNHGTRSLHHLREEKRTMRTNRPLE
ncbi:hypothetical protein [Silvimonas sp.]|uniref:hypothetical protein n=1 Tax=Silvimonas sp. TaxID=2650811 RepID=UPI00284BF810|nr:hypothetical protein [Silvimonas sp.]MDR3430281.1 hypothetical protein [Silvimonas sp.]